MDVVKIFRGNMSAVSKLLIAIASSYAFFIFVSYAVYIFGLQVSGNIPVGLPTYGFSISAISPIMTVGDAVIMTWFLTRDVASRTLQVSNLDSKKAKTKPDEGTEVQTYNPQIKSYNPQEEPDQSKK